MNIILICTALVVGWISGYASNAIFSSNKHAEEIALAFERGKDYERMRNTCNNKMI